MTKLSQSGLFRLQDETCLILASASPRRKTFFDGLGVPYRICHNSDPEKKPRRGENAEIYTVRAAEAKALRVARNLSPEAFQVRTLAIVSADTVVGIGPRILGKPGTPDKALSMLRMLSGNEHAVTTSVTLLLKDESGEKIHSFTDSTRVFFHAVSEDLLRAYVSTGEPLDKAGAYAIQEQGAFLVKKLEGSWSTVVGLPIDRLVRVLLDHRILLPGLEKA
ncbi:MAG: Maf family protein [Desulfovibrio sp.]|nr:Maf family protein [Desulfovibrio sp.]